MGRNSRDPVEEDGIKNEPGHESEAKRLTRSLTEEGKE